MANVLQVENTNYQEFKNDLQKMIRECVLEAYLEVQPAKPEPSDRIDRETVKQMTGQGDSWVYKKTWKGCPDQLPHEKFGKRLVFSRKAVQKYIDRHTKATTNPDEIMTETLANSARKKLNK
jgi:hypothetical protein